MAVPHRTSARPNARTASRPCGAVALTRVAVNAELWLLGIRVEVLIWDPVCVK